MLVRPMLFVHGYAGNADQGKPLAELAGHDGGVFRAGHEDEFRQQVREHGADAVYRIQLSRPLASYVELAPELTTAIGILNEETGLEVDVAAHSMGGLVTRQHLQNGNDGVHDVYFMGTPNNGSAGASWTQLLGKAPRDMRESPRNLNLNALNAGWPAQLAKLNRAVGIAGALLPTATLLFPFWAPGDGTVTERSVYLEGMDRHRIMDTHMGLIRNPKVLSLILTESG